MIWVIPTSPADNSSNHQQNPWIDSINPKKPFSLAKVPQLIIMLSCFCKQHESIGLKAETSTRLFIHTVQKNVGANVCPANDGS